MGCDGGTIPRRDELVRTKKKPEQKNKNSVMVTKWQHCSINQEKLRPPIMACELGRLYNKESVIEFLLDRTKFEAATNFAHIRGLKDLKELQLTVNPDAVKSKAENADSYIDVQKSDFICPVTGLEMSGRYRFSFIWSCGCVVSERAMKEVNSLTCYKCGKAYIKEDVIPLNGGDEDVEILRSRMATKRERIKHKKTKAGSKHKVETVTSDNCGPSSSKRQKAETTYIKPTETTNICKSSNLISKESKSFAKGKPQDKQGGIQSDPKASTTYKSLFTSSSAAKNQTASHWVTYNPMYY